MITKKDKINKQINKNKKTTTALKIKHTTSYLVLQI